MLTGIYLLSGDNHSSSISPDPKHSGHFLSPVQHGHKLVPSNPLPLHSGHIPLPLQLLHSINSLI